MIAINRFKFPMLRSLCVVFFLLMAGCIEPEQDITDQTTGKPTSETWVKDFAVYGQDSTSCTFRLNLLSPHHYGAFFKKSDFEIKLISGDFVPAVHSLSIVNSSAVYEVVVTFPSSAVGSLSLNLDATGTGVKNEDDLPLEGQHESEVCTIE